MLFKDLIAELKKVKQPSDISLDAVDMLVSAAVSALMHKVDETNELDDIQALERTRIYMLKYFDNLLLLRDMKNLHIPKK